MKSSGKIVGRIFFLSLPGLDAWLENILWHDQPSPGVWALLARHFQCCMIRGSCPKFTLVLVRRQQVFGHSVTQRWTRNSEMLIAQGYRNKWRIGRCRKTTENLSHPNTSRWYSDESFFLLSDRFSRILLIRDNFETRGCHLIYGNLHARSEPWKNQQGKVRLERFFFNILFWSVLVWKVNPRIKRSVGCTPSHTPAAQETFFCASIYRVDLNTQTHLRYNYTKIELANKDKYEKLQTLSQKNKSSVMRAWSRCRQFYPKKSVSAIVFDLFFFITRLSPNTFLTS